MSERLDLIKENLIALNSDLPKPLKLDYVNYHNPQFDIIITVNQPLNAQDAATKLSAIKFSFMRSNRSDIESSVSENLTAIWSLITSATL
jgi:hypothetical protein